MLQQALWVSGTYPEDGKEEVEDARQILNRRGWARNARPLLIAAPGVRPDEAVPAGNAADYKASKPFSEKPAAKFGR